MVSFYQPRRDGLKAIVNVKKSEQDEGGIGCSAFSKFERYLLAGQETDVVIMSMDTREKLGCLNGHNSFVSVVKFNSDASKIISGSHDANIFVWDWQIRDTPSMILRWHSSPISSVALRIFFVFRWYPEYLGHGQRDTMGDVRYANYIRAVWKPPFSEFGTGISYYWT